MIADNGDFCRQKFWPFCHMTRPWALSSFHRHWVITANWLESLFIVGFSDFQRLFALTPVFRSDLLSRVRPQRNTALVLWLCCGCVVVVLTYVPVRIFISFCLLLWVCKQANHPGGDFKESSYIAANPWCKEDSDIRSYSENLSMIASTPGIWHRPVSIVALAVSGLAEMRRNHIFLDVFCVFFFCFKCIFLYCSFIFRWVLF